MDPTDIRTLTDLMKKELQEVVKKSCYGCRFDTYPIRHHDICFLSTKEQYSLLARRVLHEMNKKIKKQLKEDLEIEACNEAYLFDEQSVTEPDNNQVGR